MDGSVLAIVALSSPEAVVSSAAAGLGLGVALASAPGPVQAILLTESIRGGTARGFRAQAGANVTMALLLVALALGLSVAAPTGTALRVLKIVGGAFLLLLAADGFRAQPIVTGEQGEAVERRRLGPEVRGTMAVLLNPGAWLFLATAASSFLSSVTDSGGRGSAVLAALALAVGVALGDTVVVLFGGIGLRRAGSHVGLWVRRGLATVLGALGVWLVIGAMVG